jgi:anthranilate 1,2-dioxygenase small subunit
MNSADLFQSASELMADYAELLDADRLEDWVELFTEDATYDVVPRENVEQGLQVSLMLCSNKAQLRDRITALRQANEYNLHYDCHLVTGIRARETDEGIIQIGASYAVFQTSLEGQSRLFSVGRYQDCARVVGSRLLLCKKRIIVDTFSVPTLLATPL